MRSPHYGPYRPKNVGVSPAVPSFIITTDKTVSLAGVPAFSITAPADQSVHAGTYHVALYDPQRSWADVAVATVSNSTVRFGGTHTAITLKAGVRYVLTPAGCFLVRDSSNKAGL